MLFDMQDRPESPHILRFGRFELQPPQRRLLADGQTVALGARAFDVLVTLASRAGQLVTKSELLDEVWSGLVVEEANLSVQVSTLRKVLGADLIATIPGRGYRFTERVEVVSADASAAASTEVTPATSIRSAPNAAPALIGRDDELAELQHALGSPGCVTLVGPAGVGKTVLARALAVRMPSGSVWVDLAPLTAGEQVTAAVAHALGTDSAEAGRAERLRAKLGTRTLVLDNAEHVIDDCATLVSQWCRADAHVSVLVTSQLPLAVAGERVQRLGPLALPGDGDAIDLHQGAVALFIERVRAADHRFQATPEQLPLVREICRRLDGLPLALEMAAARAPVLGLRELAQALERRLALLKGRRRDADVRHRTLQAALDWSHDLLSPEEQRLYRLCGVFSGGFALDLLLDVALGNGVRTAAADDDERRWAVVDTLSQLIDRSLVSAGTGEPPRYQMLETMREDALRRLRVLGEDEDARARLLSALAGLAHRYRLHDPPLSALQDALLAERDNLREAIAWGRRHSANELQAATLTVAIAAASVATFTMWRSEAQQWLESLEPLAESAAMPMLPRARWWTERARQSYMSRSDRAIEQAERALALARGAGDGFSAFLALSTLVRAGAGTVADQLGFVQAMTELLQRHPDWSPRRALMLVSTEAIVLDRQGDRDNLLRCRLRELDLTRRAGSDVMATAVETNIVFALHSLRRHEEALVRARELIARLGSSDSGNAAYAWLGLVMSLQALRRHAEFRDAMPHAARVLRKHDLPLLGPPCALVLAAEGRLIEALRMLGHARAAFAARGMRMTEEEQAELGELECQARAALGEAAVDLCLSEGAALGEPDVDAMMLRTPFPAAAGSDAWPALASPR